jgi:hypothetical protein
MYSAVHARLVSCAENNTALVLAQPIDLEAKTDFPRAAPGWSMPRGEWPGGDLLFCQLRGCKPAGA